MQGRGRRDEDVDDEAVYDDVAYTREASQATAGGRARRAVGSVGRCVEHRHSPPDLFCCVSHVEVIPVTVTSEEELCELPECIGWG